MRTSVFFIFIVFLAIGAKAQIQVAVQLAEQSTFYTSYVDALDAAPDGATIYLPAGSFESGNRIIKKSLKIVGIGYKAASNPNGEITQILGDFTIAQGASGIKIEGISIKGSVFVGTTDATASVENITFSRCHFEQYTLNLSNGTYVFPTKNVILYENIIDNIDGGKVEGVLAVKNIFKSSVVNFANSATFRNNIFLNKGTQPTFVNVKNATIENNVFLCGYSQISNSSILNNIFVSGEDYQFSTLNNIASGNITTIPLADIFVNATTGVFSLTNDYHLKAGSPGLTAGTDTYTIGIYGTALPFKDTATPTNPHIDSYKINSSTDTQGRLNVVIKVSAQTN